MKNLILWLLPETWIETIIRRAKFKLLREKVEQLILLRDESRRPHHKYSHIQNRIVETNTEILKLEAH